MIKTTIKFLTALLLSISAYASDSVVSTAWVAENLNDNDIRIVEVSVEPGKFERAHVPGAANLRWHTDLVDPVKRDIVSKENFEEMMSRLGIDNNTTVVLYGDHNNWFAAWGPGYPGTGYIPDDTHIGPSGWHLLLGGLTFGWGMSLSGSCISAHFYRIGEGSMLAPVALIGAVGGFILGMMSWNSLYILTISNAPVIWIPEYIGYSGSLIL